MSIKRYISNHIPDKQYLKLRYKRTFGKKLNLDNPQTFNEKLQWLKLYDRRPEYTIMVDKYAVKKYVADKIGEEYIIPTLGVWDNPDDIDFDALPSRFVLKCNHNSGLGMCICKDKSKLDIEKVRSELRRGLAQDYYLTGREWPYKNVPRKIIAEKYMEDAKEDVIRDYKWFCFDGKPQFMYISNDGAEHSTTDFFDMEFNHLPFRFKDPNSEILPSKPLKFDEMRKLAGVLSEGIPHVRVDFYLVNGNIYFGELTFFHNSGFGNIQPKEYEKIIGDMISLPTKTE